MTVQTQQNDGHSAGTQPQHAGAGKAVHSATAGAAHIQARGDNGPAPLTSPQERLWFLEQLEPGNLAYVTPIIVKMTGPLDAQVLHRCLSEIVRRHDSIRTGYGDENGVPFQWALPHAVIELPVDDLSVLPPAERDAKADAIILGQSREPFDLTKPPLVRIRLIKLDAQQHVLAGAIHHINADGWSIAVLITELSQLYSAYAQNQPSPLQDLSIQFADYAVWHRKFMAGDETQRLLAYWREQMAGSLPVLNLPTDLQRPAVMSHRGARQSHLLPVSLIDDLKKVSRESRVSLFMTMLGAFDVLMHRYTGQTDVIVGSAIANRTRIQTEKMIGNFVNTLALRVDCSGDPTFADLLIRVRDASMGAFAHQDMPFEKLVHELDPVRDPSRSPIVQVAFGLQNMPQEWTDAAGVRFERIRGDNHTAKFDLTLDLTRQDDSWLLWAEYCTDLFDDATITRLLNHYQVLLRCIIANPHERISRLQMLDETERQQLLVTWNGSSEVTQISRDCIHERVERAALINPQSVAVNCGEQSLTFAQLHAQANRMARLLQSHGVTRGSRVGVFLERSTDLITTFLAVLKTGAAYVPMDPIYPAARLAMVIEDAAPAVLITQASLQTKLPSLASQAVPCICLDDVHVIADIAQQSDANLNIQADADDLAYVIFTSGSTGRPKGVMVTHRNVTRLFDATEHWFHFDHTDVWTMFHSAAFDFSVWEMWGALMHGGRLVVVPQETSRNPQLFHELLQREQVTVLNQTPSAFYQLVRADADQDASSLKNLRHVIFGGEALAPAALVPWFDRHGDQQPKLINMYGITETTVHVTYQPLTRADAVAGTGSVIGVPIPDLRIYLLDQTGQLVPIGVPGEIHVGGPGVAKGYLNQPQLTADRFVHDPFGTDPQQRLYRSGDLARWLTDGRLEYLGRIDKQVQVRGFRVELGEIEAALRRLSVIRDVAVVCRTDDGQEQQLIAYVVPRESVTLHADLIRESLRRQLPDYMIPDAIVMLSSLPLTANGKIDERALPLPSGDRPELQVSYAAPRNDIEKQLAGIWAQVLGIDQVGIEDNFFDLGGHSLIATTLVAMVADTMKMRLQLSTVFEYPTIAQMAPRLQQSPASSDAGPAMIIGRAAARNKAANPHAVANLTDDQVNELLRNHPGTGVLKTPTGA